MSESFKTPAHAKKELVLVSTANILLSFINSNSSFTIKLVSNVRESVESKYLKHEY